MRVASEGLRLKYGDCPPLHGLLENPRDPVAIVGEKVSHLPTLWCTPEWMGTQQALDLTQYHINQGPLGHVKVKPTTIAAHSRFWPMWARQIEGKSRAVGQGRLQDSSSAWSEWAPGLKQAVEESIDRMCLAWKPFLKKTHTVKAVVPRKRFTSFSEHIAQGHIPYRADCQACLEGRLRGRPHRRQPASESFVLSLDLLGPHKRGHDELLPYVRHFVVAVYTFPQCLSDKAPPAGSGDGTAVEEKEARDKLRSPSGPEARDELRSPSGPEARDELRSPSGPEARDELRSSSGPEARDELRSRSGPEARDELGCPSGPEARDELRSESEGVEGPPRLEEPEQEWEAPDEEDVALPAVADPKVDLTEEESLPRVKMVELVWAEPLSRKTAAETLRAVKRVEAKLALLGLPVVRVHTDGGGEFCNKGFRDWCDNRGFVKSSTGGDDFRSNGRVENAIGVLNCRARTLLRSSEAEWRDWPFAIRHAAFQHRMEAFQKLRWRFEKPVPFMTKVHVKERSWRLGAWTSRVVPARVLAPSKEVETGYLVRTEGGDLMNSKVLFQNVVAPPSIPAELPPECADSTELPTPTHRIRTKGPVAGRAASLAIESQRLVKKLLQHQAQDERASFLAHTSGCNTVLMAQTLLSSGLCEWGLFRDLAEKVKGIFFGAFAQHDRCGVTKATLQCPGLAALALRLVKEAAPNTTFSSIAILSKGPMALHQCKYVLPCSKILLPLEVPESGGAVWVEDELGDDMREVCSGLQVRGRVFLLKRFEPFFPDPNKWHTFEPVTDGRSTLLVAYAIEALASFPMNKLTELWDLGLPLPTWLGAPESLGSREGGDPHEDASFSVSNGSFFHKTQKPTKNTEAKCKTKVTFAHGCPGDDLEGCVVSEAPDFKAEGPDQVLSEVAFPAPAGAEAKRDEVGVEGPSSGDSLAPASKQKVRVGSCFCCLRDAAGVCTICERDVITVSASGGAALPAAFESGGPGEDGCGEEGAVRACGAGGSDALDAYERPFVDSGFSREVGCAFEGCSYLHDSFAGLTHEAGKGQVFEAGCLHHSFTGSTHEAGEGQGLEEGCLHLTLAGSTHEAGEGQVLKEVSLHTFLAGFAHEVCEDQVFKEGILDGDDKDSVSGALEVSDYGCQGPGCRNDPPHHAWCERAVHLKAFIGREVCCLREEPDGSSDRASTLEGLSKAVWDLLAVQNKVAKLDAPEVEYSLLPDCEVLCTHTVPLAEVYRHFSKWRDSAAQELHALLQEKQAFRSVGMAELRALESKGSRLTIVPSKAVFTRKSGGRFKTRVVICGNFLPQDSGHEASREPKASLYTAGCEVAHVRQIAARGVRKQWTGLLLDIKTAFLNSLLLDPVRPRTAPAPSMTNTPAEIIAVKPPKILIAHGMAREDEYYLCLRAVYGLPQSPRDWGITRDKELAAIKIDSLSLDLSGVAADDRKEIGPELVLVPSAADSQVWALRSSAVGPDGLYGPALAWITVYVDDVFIMGPLVLARAIAHKIQATWETGGIQEIPQLSEGVVTYFGIEFA